MLIPVSVVGTSFESMMTLGLAAADEQGRAVGLVITRGFRTTVVALAVGFEPEPIVVVAEGLDPKPTWEHRGPGVWVDANRERSGWSLGLECFGVMTSAIRVDAETLGHRVPLGWELDVVGVSGGLAGFDGVAGSVEGVVLGPWGETELVAAATVWVDEDHARSDGRNPDNRVHSGGLVSVVGDFSWHWQWGPRWLAADLI